jgi:putative endonuclease
MGDPRHLLGLAAEAAVAGWLTDAGWEVLERRARSPAGGEVDLVALDTERTLVAIEVRARRSRRAGGPAMSIDVARVTRLRRTLAGLASTGRYAHAALRVDLVTVEPSGAPGRWRLVRLPGVG